MAKFASLPSSWPRVATTATRVGESSHCLGKIIRPFTLVVETRAFFLPRFAEIIDSLEVDVVNKRPPKAHWLYPFAKSWC
jgi:hypothetical protein